MPMATYVRGAERMLTYVEVGPHGLWVRFADDVEGVVPLKALKLPAPPVRVSLPEPYVLHLELANGTVEEIPWDYLRHFVDEGYATRSKQVAVQGRQALGKRIKGLRMAAGLTQAGLAEQAGISRVTLARIELGTQSPRWETLVALSRALKVPVARLLRG